MREANPAADPAAPPWRDLLLIGLLSAAVTLVGCLLFYGTGIATGRELFFTHDLVASDIWHLHYPVKHFLQHELAAGRLPLWSPEIGTGFPLHAEGQVAALYPPNLALFGLLPLALAFNWGILLHAVLAGALVAMLARQLGAGRGGSVIAAIAFTFSGFFVTHVKHINMTAAAVWIPLLILLMERFAARRSVATLVLFAVAVAAMVLAGHPQIAYNNLLIAGLWALVLVVRIWRRRPREGGGLRNAARFGGGLGYAVVIGVLLAAPQLLPTAELNQVGPRKGGLTMEEATEWEYRPEFLLAYVAPDHFGEPGRFEETPVLDPETGQPLRTQDGRPLFRLQGFDSGGYRSLYWEMMGYLGLLPLVLALAAFAIGVRKRRGAVAMLGGFLVLSVLFSLGKYGGLFHVAWYLVPGFRFFRFHDRFMLYAALCIAVLAGLGFTWLVAMAPAARRRVANVAGTIVVGGICFFDLFAVLGDHNPRIARERWESMPPAAERIHQEEGSAPAPPRMGDHDTRGTIFGNAYARARGWAGDLAPYDIAKNALYPNLNLLYGIGHLQLYFQLYPRWMREASRLFYYPSFPQQRGPIGMDRIADVFNVRYILAPRGPFFDTFPGTNVAHPLSRVLDRLPVIATYPGDGLLQSVTLASGETALIETSAFELRLYRNPDALPRALLVPHARRLVEEETPPRMLTASQRALLDPGFDPWREVIVHDGDPELVASYGEPGDPLVDAVNIRVYEPQRVVLEVDAPRDCWLFLSDTYYPGWIATVDGQETRIHRANVTGRALQIPEGQHEVVFAYEPTSLRNGFLLAALGLLLLVTLWLQARLAARLRWVGRRASRTRSGA